MELGQDINFCFVASPCIHDLDEYWQSIGFSSKQRATTILKKHFSRDQGYCVQSQTIHRPQNSTRIDKYFINHEALNFLKDYGAHRKSAREKRKDKTVELLSGRTVERYSTRNKSGQPLNS